MGRKMAYGKDILLVFVINHSFGIWIELANIKIT